MFYVNSRACCIMFSGFAMEHQRGDPEDLTVLFEQDKHISCKIWNGVVRLLFISCSISLLFFFS